ncbi:porin family protein [Larkinella terrae]|uniref:Outer membrane beta-barrel protein n=1 Tax=Larkinella terrae TaxID=2025311 RepID=A0A7K0EJJ5_9BACT|nr:porin family protein [Larkinella terrae]MRS61608.1 outer membrane beta-barrel protein [Larkinella terrae]
MKKILFLGMVMILPSLTFAQFSFGIKGGVNLSQFKTGEFVTTRLNANGTPQVNVSGQVIRDNLKESFDSKTGWAYGIYTRFGKNLFIQPELLVSSKGGSFDIVRDINGQPKTETVSIKTTNFDVPILLGLKGGPIRVVAGPIVSFRVSDDQKLRDALRDYTSGSLNNALAKASYGYQIGLGLDLGRLGVDVRREGSLSDVAAVNLGGDANSAQFSQRLKSWQVTLALRLF